MYLYHHLSVFRFINNFHRKATGELLFLIALNIVMTCFSILVHLDTASVARTQVWDLPSVLLPTQTVTQMLSVQIAEKVEGIFFSMELPHDI